MCLEHGIQERPACLEAVLLTGSYANTDHASKVYKHMLVMGQALHQTPLPVITCMSPIDSSCGTAAQADYWSCFQTADGLVVSTGSKLEVNIFDDWSHEDLSAFFGVYELPLHKLEAILCIWERFFNLVRLPQQSEFEC